MTLWSQQGVLVTVCCLHLIQFALKNVPYQVDHTRWTTPGGPHQVDHTRWTTPGGPHQVDHTRWTTPGGPHQVDHTLTHLIIDGIELGENYPINQPGVLCIRVVGQCSVELDQLVHCLITNQSFSHKQYEVRVVDTDQL